MKTKPILQAISLLFLIVILSYSQLYAQSEAQASTTLELQNQYNRSETIAISPSEKIKVKTLNGKKCKGKISAVRDSSFFLGQEEIAFSAVQKITVSKTFNTGIASKVALLYGLANALFSVLFFFLGYWMIRSTNDQASFLGALIGISLIALAGILGITAIIFILAVTMVHIMGKASAISYLIGRKWHLRKQALPNDISQP